MKGALYLSRVMHQRLRPRPHRLAYSIFSVLLDLDTLEQDAAGLRLFSLNRFNLFSFFETDRGDGRRPLADYVRETLRNAGLAREGLRIRLLTMPRVLGFAFNPLSVYFIERGDGGLHAVLWEVDNTFGERHSYLIPAIEGAGDLVTQTCAKDFYVSPFMPMALTYRFRFRVPGESLSLHITASDSDGALLIAAQRGERRPLTDAALLRLFLRLPFQAAWVLGAIHVEALRLWRKGIRLVPKPEARAGTISYRPEQSSPRMENSAP